MDADLAPSQGRKLASIVSIDIAGYSRLAETDEAAALAAVNAVRARIARVSAAHEGRLFSSAGDGFMLEFPTATGALTAAEEIATGEPAVRVGVHLGEVYFTEGGDMLGHGVNIAARIQQMATPRAVLVSGDVKRSVRGDLGARLVPRGTVRLDKMAETLPVFELHGSASQKPRIRRIDWRLGAGALIAAVFVIGLAVIMTSRMPTAPQARIAVLPFRTIGDDATLHTFADGLADRIVGALSARRFLTVSPDNAVALRGPDANRSSSSLGVDLVLDGGVQRTENAIGVDARIEDARGRSVVWSVSLQGSATQAADLQARVATRIVAEMYCGERAFRRDNGLADPAALSAYLRACDLFLVHSDDSQFTYELLSSLRQVTSIAPGFSAAHSDIAKYEAYFLDQFPADQVAGIRHDVDVEAHRALQLDPHNADAYVALYLLLPPERRAEAERLLRQGLAIDPDWPHANGFLGNLLTEVGRVQEASTHYQRAAAANPLSGGLSWSGQNAIGLDYIGRADLADRAVADITRLWSDDDLDTWRVRMEIAFAERRWDQALSLLNDPAAIPRWLSPDDIAMYRSLFRAARSGNRQEIEAERRALIDQGGRGGPGFVVRALCALGFVDDAFAIIERKSDEQLVGSSLSDYLFSPTLAPLRRDPRFMRVAARLGLIDYWRATNTQPDFCRERDLPYNCSAEEERARPRGTSSR